MLWRSRTGPRNLFFSWFCGFHSLKTSGLSSTTEAAV
jgi:hypothetical protein